MKDKKRYLRPIELNKEQNQSKIKKILMFAIIYALIVVMFIAYIRMYIL